MEVSVEVDGGTSICFRGSFHLLPPTSTNLHGNFYGSKVISIEVGGSFHGSRIASWKLVKASGSRSMEMSMELDSKTK